MVKTTQKMKKGSLGYPEKPKKTDADCLDSSGDPDPDAFDMAYLRGRKTMNQ
jgi:hypothetical protein